MKMKNIIAFAMLLSSAFAFAQNDSDDVNEWVSALEESTMLLERAYNEIESLEQQNANLDSQVEELEAQLQQADSNSAQVNEDEKERLQSRIKELEDENDELRVSIAEASNALKESNDMLERAYSRIDEDQKEIERLRQHIESLIASGVDIQTYSWNLMFLGGYPQNAGFQVAYNLPWFPDLGALVGFSFNFESTEPVAYAGIKINLE